MKRRTFIRTGSLIGAVGAAGALGVGLTRNRAGRKGAPGVASGTGTAAPTRTATGPAAAPDLVLRRATVFDGTGAPGLELDVAITGDRITEVGTIAATGVEEIDLAGMALAPGFIDIHSHADLSLLVNPNAESRIRQGVTLEIVGQDGNSVGPMSDAGFRATRDRYRDTYGVDIGFRDLGGFLDQLDRTPATVNLATMVGHGTIRGLVVGGENRPATDGEIQRMRALIGEALDQGAVGFSSGLEYTPGSFADVNELVELARELQGTGYPYASHMRNEDDRLFAAVEETLHVGRMAGVPIQISHLKAQGERNWWKATAVLRSIEEARTSGLDVHFDRYPYIAYATGLSGLFPAWARAGGTGAFIRRLEDPAQLPAIERFTRAKVALLGSWDAVQISSIRTAGNAYARGRRLGELARERGEEPFALTVRLIVEERNSVGMIGFGMSEENTAEFLAHPLGMVCSDGGSYAPYGALSGGSPHPRGYGTFPRLMGHYVRSGALSLELAVHKATALPARKIGLADRGVIEPGAFADLVAFDPTTVADQATFEDPHQYPVGIPLVIVNGQVTLRDGEQTGARAGRAIRGRGAAA
ncbi:MAG: D-aminoacylase [Gemmatimonadetes bacterium]|nr:D-aminoacylase [Gemmatimonadota bacterium]